MPPFNNQPSSKAREARAPNHTPNMDKQSSASDVEHLEGDDHPAKNADPQGEPTRSTGFGAQSETAGGEKAKEGKGGSG
jgi:hypothetical protein